MLIIDGPYKRYSILFYGLLVILLSVCMEYTALGDSRVANIAQNKAECYICHEALTKCCRDTNETTMFYVVYFIFHLLTLNKIQFFDGIQ